MKMIILSSLILVSFSAMASVGENHSTDNCRLVNQENRPNMEIIGTGSGDGAVRTNSTGAVSAE